MAAYWPDAITPTSPGKLQLLPTPGPRAQGPGRFRLLPEVGRPEPLAYGTRLQEEGTASPGAPPPALEHLGAGWVGV